jgi:hypothetical protein
LNSLNENLLENVLYAPFERKIPEENCCSVYDSTIDEHFLLVTANMSKHGQCQM